MTSYVCPSCSEESGEVVDRRRGDAGGWVRVLECLSCEHRWEFSF